MVFMFLVGRIGKSVGFNGGLKFYLESDFLECLKKGVKVSVVFLNVFFCVFFFKEYVIYFYEYVKNLLFLEMI